MIQKKVRWLSPARCLFERNGTVALTKKTVQLNITISLLFSVAINFILFGGLLSCTNSSQQHRQKATVCSDEILGQFYIKDRNVDVDSMRITTIVNNRETQSVLYYGLRNSKNGYVDNKSTFKIEDSLNLNNQYLIELYSNGKVYKNFLDQIDYRREIVYNGSVCKVRSYVLNNNFKENYMNGFELELIEDNDK
jgi:hypothetical protein